MLVTSSFLISAIVAGFAFAGLDLVRKKLSGMIPAAVIVVWMMVATCTFFGSWLIMSPRPMPLAGYFLPALVSVVVNVVANLLFLKAIYISPFSRTIPFLSLSPAFASISAYFVLGESPVALQWIGITLVVIGALMLNLAHAGGNFVASIIRSLRQEKGSLLMIATAIGWGIAAPFDKIAISRAGIPVHGFVMGAGVGVCMIIFLAARRELKYVRQSKDCWQLLLLAMIISVVAFGVQLLAYSEGYVGIAETIKRVIGMSSALALGALFFGEKIKRLQIIAVLLMALGVSLIF